MSFEIEVCGGVLMNLGRCINVPKCNVTVKFLLKIAIMNDDMRMKRSTLTSHGKHKFLY